MQCCLYVYTTHTVLYIISKISVLFFFSFLTLTNIVLNPADINKGFTWVNGIQTVGAKLGLSEMSVLWYNDVFKNQQAFNLTSFVV